MTDYKPGTVAVATVRGVPNVQVVRVEYPTTPPWMTLSEHPTGAAWHSEAEVTDVRPLVVLDLLGFDAQEAVRSLEDAANGQLPRPGRYDERRSVVFHVAQAVREQTRPPKPAEPTGLGAVVEDRDGLLWIRVSNRRRSSFRQSNGENPGRYRDYSDIPAVRVLSSGVEA